MHQCTACIQECLIATNIVISLLHTIPCKWLRARLYWHEHNAWNDTLYTVVQVYTCYCSLMQRFLVTFSYSGDHHSQWPSTKRFSIVSKIFLLSWRSLQETSASRNNSMCTFGQLCIACSFIHHFNTKQAAGPGVLQTFSTCAVKQY